MKIIEKVNEFLVKSTKMRIENVLYFCAAFFLLLCFFVPLVVFTMHFFYPHITVKMWIFRTLVILSATCVLPLFIAKHEAFKIKMPSVHWFMLLYLFALLASCAFGVNTYHSFWGSYERMMGIFSIAHFALLLFLLPIIFRSWSGKAVEGIKFLGWRWPIFSIIISSFCVAIIGFVQYRFPGLIYGATMDSRVFSTLGNSVFLGNYLALSLGFIFIAYKKTHVKIARAVLIFVFFVNFYAMLLSGSRGAFLALIAGLFAVSFFVLILTNGTARKYSAVMFTVLILVSVVLFLSPIKTLVNTRSPVARLFNIMSDHGPRKIAFKIAYNAWIEKPVFGWGHANFATAFNAHYDPEMLKFSFVETWFDNAHNIIVETLATTGIFGLFCFLAFYLSVLIMLVKLQRKNGIDKFDAYAVFAILAVDFFSKMFVFDSVSSCILWISALSYAVSLYGIEHVSGDESTSAEKNYEKPQAALVAIILAIGIGFVVVTDIIPLKNNYLSMKYLKELYQNPKDAKLIIDKFNGISDIHSMSLKYYFASRTREILPVAKSVFDNESYNEIIGNLISGLDTAYNADKNNLHVVYEQINLALLANRSKGASDYIKDRFSAAINLSPKRQQTKYMIVKAAMNDGQLDAALSTIQSVIDTGPDIGYSYWLRGMVYYEMGKFEEAWRDVYKATRELLFVPETIEDMNFTSQVYFEAKYPYVEYDEYILKQLARAGRKPAYNILKRLSEGYKELGLYEMSYQTALQIKDIFPEKTKEIKNLLTEPKVLVSSKKLMEIYYKYRIEKNEQVPLYVYYSLVHALAYEDNFEMVEKVIEVLPTKPVIGLTYSEITHKKMLECIKDISSIQKPAHVPVQECEKVTAGLE